RIEDRTIPAPTVPARPRAITTAPDGCVALSKVIKIPMGIKTIAEIKKARVISSAAFTGRSFAPLVTEHNEDSGQREPAAVRGAVETIRHPVTERASRDQPIGVD